MSAGGWGGYRVIEAALAERRRRSAALDRQARLMQRYRIVTAKAKARRARKVAAIDVTVAKSLGETSETSSTDQIEAHNAELERELDHVEARLTRAEQEESRAQLEQHLAEIANAEAVAGLRARAEAERQARAASRPANEHRPRPAEPTTAPEHDARDVAEVVAAIVADARPAATAGEGDELERLAEEVVRDGDGAEIRLRRLKRLASRIMGSTHERAQAAKRAARLRDTLDGLPGAAVARARELLDEIVAGERALVSSDVERIERIRAEAEAEAERVYVAEQLDEAIRRAGCEVQQGFATEVLTGRAGYVGVPDSPEHAVEWELGDDGFRWRTVRASGQPDPGADASAQQLTCRMLGEVTANAYESGVRIRLSESAEPGEMAVEYVAAAQQALGRRTAAPDYKTRSIDR